MSLEAFSPSEDELNLASQILLLSGQEGDTLESGLAIGILKRSGLPYTILHDIVNMVDENASRELTIHELAAAIRLMGWLQTGESLEESLLATSGPLPTLNGITDVGTKHNASPKNCRFSPVSHDDMSYFKRTFNSAGPLDGYLDGDIVLEIYMLSNLSYGDLWKIRKLVDVTERGALDFREFAMGMYLIQAIQSCSITSVPSTVPPELHDLFLDPALLDLHPTSKRPPHLHRSKTSSTSLSHSSSSRSQILLGSKTPLAPVHISPEYDSWDISPTERVGADKNFHKLDLDCKGYIEGKTAANFMLKYKLSPPDLARIWNLVDLNGDNRLTKDEFAVAMHLINRKMAGEEIPANLPPSLIPPSMRSKVTPSTTPVPLSPKQLAKFKSPPPLPPKRGPSRVKRSDSSASGSNLLSPLPTLSKRPSYSTLSPNPPMSPILISSLSTPPLTPSNYSETAVVSPFEDPTSGPSTPHRSPPPVSMPPLNNANNEALEEFKKETSRLTLQVDSLLSQLTAQNSLRDTNEALVNERDSLKAQVREMERTISEVLSAHDQNGSLEQYIQEVGRLSIELANKESQHESTQRILAVLTGEEKDLKRQLRESQAATAKAKSEAENLQQSLASHKEQLTELRARLSDMGRAMAEEPASQDNNRELRVLFRDVTRENDVLKGKLRDTQKSLEQLLLSTKFHAKLDEVERENRRLQAYVQELEMLTTELQFSGNSSTEQPQRRAFDEVKSENEQLKAQLQTGHRAFAEFRTSSEATINELQRKLATMEYENNQLKIEVSNSSGQRQEDQSIPPPAYNDSFIVV